MKRNLALILVLPALLAAQEMNKDVNKMHFVRASGEAIVKVKPDRAEISIGVITESPTAQAAAAENATQTAQVLDALKKTLGSAGELKTAGYSISAQYQYTNGQPQKLTGYQASNTVSVVVTDLSLLGKVIDAASNSGANNINAINFDLKDDSAIRLQALAEATEKARSSAEAIAKALNLKVTGVLQAETGEAPSFRPLMTQFVANQLMAPGARTPIETGNLEVRATVTVSLEIQ